MVKEAPEEREDHEQVAIRTKWTGLGDHPVYSVNRILSQFEDDLFLVTFGLLDKPVVLDNDPRTREDLKGMEYVGINPVVRLGLTETIMEQVIEVLSQNLKRYRAMKVQGEET